MRANNDAFVFKNIDVAEGKKKVHKYFLLVETDFSKRCVTFTRP